MRDGRRRRPPSPLSRRWPTAVPGERWRLGRSSVAIRGLFRRRCAPNLVLAVLLSLGGGASLAAIAGARRTISAYPGTCGLEGIEPGRQHPGRRLQRAGQGARAGVPACPASFRRRATWASTVGRSRPGGLPDFDYFDVECLGSHRGRFFDQDRVQIVHGRAAKQGRPNELVINDRRRRTTSSQGRAAPPVGFLSDAEVAGARSRAPSFRRPHAGDDDRRHRQVQRRDRARTRSTDRRSFLLPPALFDRHAAIGTYVGPGCVCAEGTPWCRATLRAYRRLPRSRGRPSR